MVQRTDHVLSPVLSGAPNDNFRKIICSEDDLRSRIFGSFSVKFLACLPLLGFSNMESQMVQKSKSKIVFTFNKFFIKVKRDFNQAQQNQVTFNGFSFKVTAYFNQAQQQKLTHSTNCNSTPREYCVKLKK